MRYSYYPMNGDHQGVAPQSDFAVLSPAATITMQLPNRPSIR